MIYNSLSVCLVPPLCALPLLQGFCAFLHKFQQIPPKFSQGNESQNSPVWAWGGRQRKTSNNAALLCTGHVVGVETFLHLSQLSARLYLWLSGWFLWHYTSVEITRKLSFFLYAKANYRALCLHVGEWVGECEIGLPMCISTQVQYLSHLKSPPNLVIIAWWAFLLSSTFRPPSITWPCYFTFTSTIIEKESQFAKYTWTYLNIR